MNTRSRTRYHFASTAISVAVLLVTLAVSSFLIPVLVKAEAEECDLCSRVVATPSGHFTSLRAEAHECDIRPGIFGG